MCCSQRDVVEMRLHQILYRLVPVGVTARNQITELIQWLSLLPCSRTWLWCNRSWLRRWHHNLLLFLLLRRWRGGRWRGGSSSFGLGVQRANLQLLLVLLQNALIVVFPELLAGVFAGNALQDLLSAWVLLLELGQVIDIVVDDDPEVVWLVVR